MQKYQLLHPDFETPETIMKHLNEFREHDVLLLFVNHYSGLDDVQSAKLVGLSLKIMTFSVTTANGNVDWVYKFKNPVDKTNQLHSHILKRARVIRAYTKRK